MSILALVFIGLSTNSAASDQLPDWYLERLKMSGGCIDNHTLVEICKSGPRFLDQYYSESFEAYNALNGTAVCLTFQAQGFSKSENELVGSFSGRSGAWAQDIFIFMDTENTVLPNEMSKGSKVKAEGNLPIGNSFYSNAIDNCFITIIGQNVELDGF